MIAACAAGRARRFGKDLRSPSFVDRGEFRCLQAGSETERDDAAGAGAGDQIEITGDGCAVEVALFEFGENSCREQSLNAAPVDR